MFFLTYNDPFSGIYKSQVIDVVNYLNSIQENEEVRLLALISLRSFSENKKKIKAASPKAIVIPMFPGVSFWKWNYLSLFFLFLFTRPSKLICRGPFATWLALGLKKNGLTKKVIFDARGAYTAEINEYNVIPDKKVKGEIKKIENAAVNDSDFRLSVSEALVDYWKEKFKYKKTEHVVVPCTLNTEFDFTFPSENEISELRAGFGYTDKDIVFVYSGSSAGWQSFSLIDGFVCNIMDGNPNVKLLVLSSDFGNNYEVIKRYSNRVKVTWVKTQEVRNYLLACDYGILFREDSVTNRVASPVKFAEYLSCGLKVLISDHLGDYSSFSLAHDLRYRMPDRVNYEEKKRIHSLAISNFLKERFKNSYINILNC